MTDQREGTIITTNSYISVDFGSNMEGQEGAAFILQNAGGIAINYDFSEWDYSG